MSRSSFPLFVICSALALAGCDMLPNPQAEAAKQESEAAAVGTGCRQSGRSIEQCLERNETLSPKSGLVKGWREMDDYMRSNKIEIQKPVEKKAPPKAADGEKAEADSADKAAEKPAKEPSASEEKADSSPVAEKEKPEAEAESKDAKKASEH